MPSRAVSDKDRAAALTKAINGPNTPRLHLTKGQVAHIRKQVFRPRPDATGWTRRDWRVYRRTMAVQHAEKSSWWAEQAEKASNYTESTKCAAIAQAFAASSQAFRAAK